MATTVTRTRLNVTITYALPALLYNKCSSHQECSIL